jgi:hypothetical protein
MAHIFYYIALSERRKLELSIFSYSLMMGIVFHTPFFNKRGNVHINITFKHVRLTTVAMQSNKY